jgi:GT2 family glycosyltransferase
MLKVSIHIVTWNSLKFLPDCLSAIFSQTYQNFSVLVIDNASSDGTVEYLAKHYPNIYLIRNNINQGFAKAHNQAINLSSAPYVLVINPDVILEKDWLERAVAKMEENKNIGSLSGKLLKIRFADIEIREKVKTNIFDSTGLKIYKNRRVVDRAEGEEDKGQYNQEEEVFGLSGACVLYRRIALESIKLKIKNCQSKTGEEYFDEDFFAYKEDVDLAWRLRLAGWQNIYSPELVAYHFRRVALSHRFSQSKWVNFLSYRNHLWLLLKNDYWSNFFRHFCFIILYQLAKELYLFFTQPIVLFKASFSFWQGFLKMWRKRQYILKRAKIKPKEIRKWMG